MSEWTVGRVAREYGVTVRTLHHYDEMGLLVPSDRTHAGYRIYAPADLERLQHIVVYRRLGFSLEEVSGLLTADGDELLEHLRRQRAAVESRIGELHELANAIDTALEREMTHTPATPEEVRELFGQEWNDEYAEEAQQRWGQTDAWKTSQARRKNWTNDDWTAMKEESDQLDAELAAAKRDGIDPDSDEAAALAERHRAGIEEHYPCSYEMQRGLADLYVGDPRFTAYYDKQEPGLAAWLSTAIHANADRHGAGPAGGFN